MATYQWQCRVCDVGWDKDYDLGKAPGKTRCPECNKLSERYYGELNFSFKDDGQGNGGKGASDFHSVRQRYKKHAAKGFDKDSANRFLNGSIENTKDRMNNEGFRYKSANFNWKKMEEDGKVKKLSPKDSADKLDRAKKLTEDAYNVANRMGYKDIGKDKLDITKPLKQQ